MDLLILRHGEAEGQAPSDFERNLTPTGREAIAAVARHLEALLKSVDLVIHSPLVRACQTAGIVMDTLNLNCPLLESELIVPEGNPQLVADFLATRSEQKILLVSHQPLVSTLAQWFVGVEHGAYPFTTGTLASLRMDVPGAGLAQFGGLYHP